MAKCKALTKSAMKWLILFLGSRSGCIGNFHLGAVARGFRDEAPVRGLTDEVPQKTKQFADTVYRF